VRPVVSGVRVEVVSAAIGPQAIARTVTALAATEAHAVIDPVAAGHSRWLRRLNSKS
jgi:hypothetical protein